MSDNPFANMKLGQNDWWQRHRRTEHNRKYMEILGDEQLDAKTFAEKAGVSHIQAYNILKKLMERGLIEKIPPVATTFKAIPSKAAEALSE